MANRFEKTTFIPKIRLGINYIIFCILLIVFFIYGVNRFSKETISYQEDTLRLALQKDIAQCYAIEGFFPPDLDYLKDHYGLVYDTDIFAVDYTAFGSNIYPDVTILNKSRKTATTIR